MPVIPTTPVSVAVADPTDLARTVVVDPALLAAMRAAAAEAQAAPEDGALEQLSALVARHDELTAELAGLQARAEAAGAELRGIVTDRIPALMAAAGVTSFATASGRKVEVGPSYSATLAKGRDESEAAYGDRFVRALAWLRERGHDGIVRDEVVVTLGRGARELAERVVAAVTALGAECRREETVHSSTLKAFVRERFEAPHGSEPPFPAELFRASAQRVATVKAVKR